MAKKKEVAKNTEKKEEKSSLQLTLERLNKTYGSGSVMSLNEKSRGTYDVIPTGSIGLDYTVLGVGGFVKGKLYELIGWEGTGKSTLCGHLSAECQKLGGTVVYIDGEHAVDKNYFQALGVNIDTMLLSQPSTGEEGFQIASEMISSGEVDLVIIDSDSSLIPKKVVDGEIGSSAIGIKARLNGDAYPKLKPLLVKNNTCVVVISQYREKIGVMFGDPRTTQGGHALKFYSDCRIEISKSLNKDGDEVVGNVTKLRTIKNKTHSPFRTCKFEILFGQGMDKKKEIIDLAHELELGKKYGKSFTWQGTKVLMEEFLHHLDDEDFFNEVRDIIIETIEKNPEDVEQIEEPIKE